MIRGRNSDEDFQRGREGLVVRAAGPRVPPGEDSSIGPQPGRDDPADAGFNPLDPNNIQNRGDPDSPPAAPDREAPDEPGARAEC